jgi:quercetin dioxygenase-like cupin family protein
VIYRRLTEMVGGWLVGDFEPTCLRTPACEVACKHYAAGAREAAHVHRIATEITLIASGTVTMNGRTLTAGDIVVVEPGEATDFAALEDTITMVVKLPSVMGDKYPASLEARP